MENSLETDSDQEEEWGAQNGDEQDLRPKWASMYRLMTS
jgi:hypothetical protein